MKQIWDLGLVLRILAQEQWGLRIYSKKQGNYPEKGEDHGRVPPLFLAGFPGD